MVQRLNDLFWPMDVREILKIHTSSRQRQDFFAWHPEKNGQFSVRSAYHLATTVHDDQFAGGASSANPDGNRPIWNLIWQSSVPLRMKHTACRAASGALATATCMQYRHLATRSTCPICGIVDEDSYHALIVCSHARAIWEA
uniref:Reverse transcriptase zinc-binding domain-containing protein n=1 Tax=Aegilops tauschii subsp. strangulata TaxID=200361 RepID=A0A453LJ72_AEGTS